MQILRRKLAAVELKYGKSDFERRHYALLALMCVYGIELLPDNIADCHANLLEIFAEYLQLNRSDDFYRAAACVLSVNLIHGDAMKMRTWDNMPITFAEWAYLWKGRINAATSACKASPWLPVSALRTRSFPNSASTRFSRRSKRIRQ